MILTVGIRQRRDAILEGRQQLVISLNQRDSNRWIIAYPERLIAKRKTESPKILIGSATDERSVAMIISMDSTGSSGKTMQGSSGKTMLILD